MGYIHLQETLLKQTLEMNIELFETAIEGTLPKRFELLKTENMSKTIIVDNNGTYGSSYTGIDQLMTSKYIRKCEVKVGAGKQIILEALPQIFRPAGTIIRNIIDSKLLPFIGFEKLLKHYYIDETGRVYIIPSNKTEIVCCEYLDLKEKFIFHKFVSSGAPLEELRSKISDTTKKILVEGIMLGSETRINLLQSFIKNFGEPPFIYPKYGSKEISEVFARNYAMSGVSYLIDTNIHVVERNDESNQCFKIGEDYLPDDYKYKLYSDVGTAFAKKLVSQKMKEKIGFVRVILLTKQLLELTFYAVAKKESYMRIIGLNSDSNCCPEDTYLIYIIKEDSCISDADLKHIGVDLQAIIFDASYETQYEYELEDMTPDLTSNH